MKHVTQILVISRKYWLWMAGAFVAMIGVSVTGLAGPWLLRLLIGVIEQNIGTGSLPYGQVAKLALMLLGVYALRPALRAFQTWTGHIAGWGSVAAARQALYEHLQSLSPRFYADTQTGQIMSRVINDTQNFEAIMAHAVLEMTVSILTLCGVTGLLFYINKTLALYTLVPIPLIVFGFYLYARFVEPLFLAAQRKLGDLSAVLQDNLSGMREIQVFTQEEREKRRIGERVLSHAWAIAKAVSVSSCISGAIDFFAGLGTVSVVFFGGQMALRGQMSIADIAGFLLYVNHFYDPVMQLNRTFEGFQQALAACDRYFEIMGTKPEIADAPDTVELPPVRGRTNSRTSRSSMGRMFPSSRT